MGDAHRLAEDLDHVEIAIGIERIAGVVGGDRDRNPVLDEFVQQGDAAPARRAVGDAVLQVHVAHGQRDDGDAGFGDPLQRCLGFGVGLDRKRATMTDDDAAGEIGAQRRVGDGAQRARVRVGRLVDVEIEVEAAIGGAVHHQFEQRGRVPGS